MNFREFFEMPMALNTVGTLGPSFDDRSRKMWANPKAQNKIVRRMEKVPHDFNVYFIEAPENKRYTSSYPLSMANSFYQRYGISPEQAPIVPGKINCFVPGWQLDPPTAWMIVHRFAHAYPDLSDKVSNVLENAAQVLSIGTPHQLLLFFGTMKSATSRNLGGADEPIHEVIAQNIMQGRNTFHVPEGWENDPQGTQQKLDYLAAELDKVIKPAMEEAKNHFFVLF